MSYKLIFLIVALSICASVLRAQTVAFGLKAGIGMSNVDYSNSPVINGINIDGYLNQRRSLGFNAVVEIELNDKLSFLVEPGYISKGDQLTGTQRTSENSTSKQHHIQLPALAKLKFSKRLFLEMGVEASYQTNIAKVAAANIYEASSYSSTDFSGIIGLGVELKPNIHLGLRANNSLIKLAEINIGELDALSEGLTKLYNRYLQFYVRYDLYCIDKST